MLPSAILSNSYFHCASPQSARMSPPEAHTLLGTLPMTYEPLFGRGVQKPTPVNQVPSLCQTQYFWVLCTHTELSIAHFAEEGTERLNYSTQSYLASFKKWRQDSNSILPQAKIFSLSPKHDEAIYRQKVIFLATFILH